MNRSFFRNMTLALAAWVMLSGVCFGKQLYLKDGGIIECQSAWRRGDLVTVKINRDTVIDLHRSEVDLKRSFAPPKKAAQSRRAHRTKPAGAAPSQVGAAPAAEGPALAAKAVAAAPASAQQPAAPAAPPAAAPAAKAKLPAPPPTAAPASAPASGAVQPEPPAPSPEVPDKAEAERRMREASEMMAKAIQKQDPEMLKRSVEAQQSAAQLAKQAGAAPAAGVAPPPLVGGTVLLIALACLLLVIASMWVVFTKAGRSGVASIIPIYNMYVLLQISGKPGWWLILLIVPVVGFIFHLLAMLSLAERFGKGILHGLGLFLLPMLFFPILAFGDAQYQ